MCYLILVDAKVRWSRMQRCLHSPISVWAAKQPTATVKIQASWHNDCAEILAISQRSVSVISPNTVGLLLHSFGERCYWDCGGELNLIHVGTILFSKPKSQQPWQSRSESVCCTVSPMKGYCNKKKCVSHTQASQASLGIGWLCQIPYTCCVCVCEWVCMCVCARCNHSFNWICFLTNNLKRQQRWLKQWMTYGLRSSQVLDSYLGSKNTFHVLFTEQLFLSRWDFGALLKSE